MTYRYNAIVESLITRGVTNRQIAKQARREMDSSGDEQHPISPPLTISGAYGSHTLKIGDKVSQKLSYHLFDREILIDICNDTKVQAEIIEALDQCNYKNIASLTDQLFNKRVLTNDSYRLILTRIIRSLVMLEPACFIGRGARHILREMDSFNIRIVASMDDRIHTIMKRTGVEQKTAYDMILRQDDNRRNFIRTHFNWDINDTTAYHLVLNTSCISVSDSIDLICTHMNKHCLVNG